MSGKSITKSFDSLDLWWGSGSPDPGIPKDHFSARFSKEIVVTKSQFYRIEGRADDGIRIYVDNQLIVDQWKDGLNFYQKDILLSVGIHEIKVEYYDSYYSAAIRVNVNPVNELVNEEWEASFFANDSFKGKPLIKKFNRFDLNWGSGSPDPSIPNDDFTAIFHRKLVVNKNSDFLFEGRADDGIKIYVDDQLIVDKWRQGVNTYSEKVSLTPGEHLVTVKYSEKKYGAAISLDISDLNIPTDEWHAAYYPNRNFKGVPYRTTVKELDLYWGGGSPSADIPKDNFSGIFEKKIIAPTSGTYHISGRADDGVRVYIDGEIVINSWANGVNPINHLVDLTKGEHTVRVEYYDGKYSAAIKVEINEANELADTWLATYYPNKEFTGLPVKRYEGRNLDLYWGGGSPAAGIPNDNFSGIFEKTISIPESGTYHISGRADDGIRVFVDGDMVINSWSNGVNPLNHLIDLTKGEHIIRVEYYDAKYSAAIKLEINKVTEQKDNWLATYYPNKNFTGLPVKRYEGSNLDLNWGGGSPDPGIPTDSFSGVLEKTISISTAGTYQVTGRADDGIRVFVNGAKVIDLWNVGVNTFSKNIELPIGNHKVRVEYYDEKYSAALKLDISVPEDTWVATYYPNKSLTGNPIKRFEGSELDLHWGNGSPDPSIPTDGFSGVFEKTFTIPKSGTYQLSGRSDDGIRIFVNGKKELDIWKAGVNTFTKNIELPAGKHKVRIEYYEEKYSAALKFELKEATKKVIYRNSKYEMTYYSALNKQMNTNPRPQTDKYKNAKAYIHKNYVEMVRTGAITENSVRLRTTPRLGDNNNIFETVNSGTKITVLGEVKGDLYQGSTLWYKIKYKNRELYVHSLLASKNAIIATTTTAANVLADKNTSSHVYGVLPKDSSINIVEESGEWLEIKYAAWRNAKQSDVEHYLNPNNFSPNTKEYFQFLNLKGSAGISISEVNNKILSGKGILNDKATAFSQAAITHNINEIYLISHALLETGNGTSELATGVEVGKNKDEIPTMVTPENRHLLTDIKLVYNMFGINANDSCALKCGSERAYKENWFTPEAAIIGGAKFISEQYVGIGQDTLYKMKWNPAAPGTHQYATDIGWAVKQTSRLAEYYSLLDTYIITFDVPIYK